VENIEAVNFHDKPAVAFKRFVALAIAPSITD